MYPCRCIGYLVVLDVLYMPPCDAAIDVAAARRGAEARSRVSNQLFARGRRAGRGKRPSAEQTVFLFYTPGLLPTSLPHGLPVVRPIHGPPIPFLLISPPPLLLLALSRLSSNSTPLPPKKAGRRSANPLLITPQVSISTTAPTRRLRGRRSQICPQPGAPPRLERGFPRCTRIL